MPYVETQIEALVSLVWGLPLVILIAASGLFFIIYSRFQPFRYLGHAIKILFKKEDSDSPGELSHWKALCTAMSGTVGMGNIAGVAMAISVGGSGAIFWMWIAAISGMAIKFFTCSLSCMYRNPKHDHNHEGGPMYYIEIGMGKRYRYLAMIFAACGMVGCLGVFQSNQLATLLEAEWAMKPLTTGFLAALTVGIIVRGGTINVGRFASLVVPIMGLSYLISASIVILAHYEQVPTVFTSIILGAFNPEAGLGGAVGLSVRQVIITGVKRAIFSNEAGVGTEALAHSTAKTTQPIREGFVGMLGPIIDTHLICTATALVILTSDSYSENGILATAEAFEKTMPGVGATILTSIFVAFAFSTLVTYAFYSLRCSSYLLGQKLGPNFLWVYLFFIMVAPTWKAETAIHLIDIAFALMVIPNLIASFVLAPKVKDALNHYIRYSAKN